jgi:glycosyltransferase involved in cell wall biosynthesis
MTEIMPTSFHLIWDGYGFENRGSGIFTCAVSLAEELASRGVHPSLFLTKEAKKNFHDFDTEIVGSIPIFGKTKAFWSLKTSQVLSHYIEKLGKKKYIYHGLSNINLPLVKPKRNVKFVLTVHDIIPLLPNARVSFSYQTQFKCLLPRALDVADAVLFDSEWTRDTVLERFPNVGKKGFVNPNGFNLQTHRESLGKDRVSDERTRVLCVSRYEHYKRLDLILELLEAGPKNLLVSLVTDRKGVLFFKKEAGKFLQSGQLKLFTKLSQEDIEGLYQNTDMVMNPSLYEGFCLPAVEALNFGKPFLYTQGSAIDDTVGKNCGIAIAKTEPALAWLDGIEKAMRMKNSTNFPNDLRAHLASRPTWNDSARKLMDLYTSI